MSDFKRISRDLFSLPGMFSIGMLSRIERRENPVNMGGGLNTNDIKLLAKSRLNWQE